MDGKFIKFFKHNWKAGILPGIFLWLMVWATYNTDIFRIFTPGFPQSALALLHEIRSFFPFFALAVAFFILARRGGLNRKIFTGPIGALLLFSLIGIFSSFFSVRPLLALYWGALYVTAILVVLVIAKTPEVLKCILILNWIIASILVIILIASFLSHSGSFSVSTIINFLSGRRPFEGMNGIAAEADFFGMAGTRPTGLGRYAGLAAIVAFVFLWNKGRKIKITAVIFFVIFFVILIFSRARTSILAFFPTIFLISFFHFEKKKFLVAITVFVLLILIPLNFYQFFYAYLRGENLLQQVPVVVKDNNNSFQPAVFTDSPVKPEPKIGEALTLSGRTTGVWKDSWELFLRSPIFGKGFNAGRIYLDGQHVHNSVLHAMVQTGIIGTIFFVFVFVWAWFLILQNLRTNKSVIFFGAVGTLAYFTLRGITESTAYFGADFLFLMPVIAYLQTSNESSTENIFYNLKYFLKNKFPPVYFLLRKYRNYLLYPLTSLRKKQRFNFFRRFIKKGDLCFDIGAHIGTLTGVFLDIGAKVIAVEPLPLCSKISEKWGSSKNLIVINKGVADKAGYLDITATKRADSISTMSEKWKTEGRFSQDFKSSETVSFKVPVTTLDLLISEYGVPKFCKIDVEGFEKEVMFGLSKPIPHISFEFTKEFLNDAKACADRLNSLGAYKFNFSIADSKKLFLKNWVASEEVFLKLGKIKNRDLWGDIYANCSRDGQADRYLDFSGNTISMITRMEVVEKIRFWVKNEHEKFHQIIVTGMHGVVAAHKRADFRFILQSADMWVPDGISLVWLAKLKGFNIKKRISGADLMADFFKVSEKEGLKNYFYGDTEDTLQRLKEKYPKIKAESYSPPFRELTEQEDKKIIEKINQARPDVLWVGLGLPKQEKWIFEHKDKLNVPVVIGVGAAFKFLSGKVKRAPKLVGDLGFEWLWRLLHEPKTTWKRVFIDMPVFVWLVLLEITGLNRYK